MSDNRSLHSLLHRLLNVSLFIVVYKNFIVSSVDIAVNYVRINANPNSIYKTERTI